MEAIGTNDIVLINNDISTLVSKYMYISNVFNDIINIPDAHNMTLNLFDYVDSDNVPSNVYSFCTEATPLINEIIVQSTYSSNSYMAGFGTNILSFTNQYNVAIELWYPFCCYTNQEDYELRVDATYSNLTASFLDPSAINYDAVLSTHLGPMINMKSKFL